MQLETILAFKYTRAEVYYVFYSKYGIISRFMTADNGGGYLGDVFERVHRFRLVVLLIKIIWSVSSVLKIVQHDN